MIEIKAEGGRSLRELWLEQRHADSWMSACQPVLCEEHIVCTYYTLHKQLRVPILLLCPATRAFSQSFSFCKNWAY